ncbi:MAG: glycosyltransferase family 9 protein [Wenzhouxiangellaceae bacterium]
MNAPESICLLRLSALGDVCNCVPVVRALRRRWPEAAITWIIGKAELKLVEGLSGVEFIPVDKQAGLMATVGDLRRRLRGRRFDVLLHAQVSLRANVLAQLVSARRRIGFDRARSREGHGFRLDQRIPARPMQHQAEALWAFAGMLDATCERADRRLPIAPEAREFARRHQPEARHAVLISPCSSHRLRDWNIAGYARVADWVQRECGRPVLLIGGPSRREIETGERIVDAMQTRALNLIGKDTLGQALAMIERAACLVTPDSGPAHFAAALGTPVVGLYAATWSRRSGPLGSLDHCVDCYPEAARRFLAREPETLRWGRRIERPGVMDLIEADAVIERLRGVLESDRGFQPISDA